MVEQKIIEQNLCQRHPPQEGCGWLPSLPAAVLSQSYDDNCLESLRAHVRDLAAGAVAVADVKLMVLGNGRVGKTQLCRRLRGEAYDETVPSTHGILVISAPVPAAEGGPAARLQIWDFGGQDISHGTHALFLRTSAIFLLVWTPALEDSREQEHNGIIFRNHPLAYWVDYVRHLGDTSSPVLIVQTRCDRPQDKATCPVAEETLAEAFGFYEVLRYSARMAGRTELPEAGRTAPQRRGAAVSSGRGLRRGRQSIVVGWSVVNRSKVRIEFATAGLVRNGRRSRQDLNAALHGASLQRRPNSLKFGQGFFYFTAEIFHPRIFCRQRAHVGLNKGEARNAPNLHRWSRSTQPGHLQQ